ncbi:MAG: Xaa-Pro peptidase family protein [Bacillota bacterium]
MAGTGTPAVKSGSVERLEQARAAMRSEGLKALVCRLPENIVMLSGYWPVIGRSAVILPDDGEPVLLAPDMERQALERAFVKDIRTFRVWKLQDPAPEASLARLIADFAASHGLAGKRVGSEMAFEDIAPTQKVLEPWGVAAPAHRMLQDAGLQVVDATELLMRLRARKTADELERIRVANEIAQFGVGAFVREARPGIAEHELAAAVEHAVMLHGTGYRGAIHARAQALIFSGTARLHEVGWGYAPNTTRRIQPGELVMLELCVVADGYYCDITRMAVAGQPSARQQELLSVVREAQKAALSAIRPGATGDQVDRAARDALKRHGLEDAFVHITGHGLGLRYHERYPQLCPGSNDVLEPGMVTSVEPGIYAPDFGGIRLEDNVVVTQQGCQVLSGTN